MQITTNKKKPMNDYLFTSVRLGLRNWILADVDKLHEIKADEDVTGYAYSRRKKGVCCPYLKHAGWFIRLRVLIHLWGYIVDQFKKKFFWN
jgi:hypothetical protein